MYPAEDFVVNIGDCSQLFASCIVSIAVDTKENDEGNKRIVKFVSTFL